MTESKVKAFLSESVKGKPKEAQEDGVEDYVFWKALDATFAKWDEEETNYSPKKELIKAMIVIHANMLRQYLLFRQHHWHVQGITFRDLHLFFDECSDGILECIDRWAERIVAFGVIVPTNPSSIQEISTIPVADEDETERDPEEMLQQTLDALHLILDEFREASGKASYIDEIGIQNIAGDVSETLEKMVYKVQSFLESV